jgi:spermidine synthase
MTPRKNLAKRETFYGVFLCFFLSGAAGLIYQVAWSKALGLIFGHTAYAIATVLAVFMGGLAAGSAFFGRWGKTQTAPLAVYSRIEFLAGAAGALSLVGLAGVRWLYLAASAHVSGMQAALLALRFLGVAAVLFIPTFLMGGTLPILVHGVTRNREELGKRVSQLYWVNTLGALAGTVLSGFALLPRLGLRFTVGVAVLMNVLAGLVAAGVAKGFGGTPVAPEEAFPEDESGGGVVEQASAKWLLILFGMVGATAFAYEIAWTRLLSIEIGSSTYAFTVILAAFLAGAAIGSVIFQKVCAGPRRVAVRTFALTQTSIGMAAIASLILFRWIPAVIPALLRETHQTFGGLVLAQMVTCGLTVLPMATIFGFNFPTVLVLLGGKAGAESGRTEAIGKGYAANTLGAIGGSLVTGFALVPWLGSFRVIAIAAAVNMLLAVALEWSVPEVRIRQVAISLAGCVLAIVVGFSSYFYNPSLLSLSAALYGNTFEGRLTLEEIAATNDLVYSAEGLNDSIAVIRSDNYVALRVNGKVDASTGDARTQLLLGHLGAALHRAPRRVLIVGYGSGMTIAAVARYPDVEKIDCVEIEPAVVRASPYLESLNRGVLSDPRVNVIFDDARNFLLTSRDKYDLIISEPSNPWIAGIAALFTNEFYAAARSRLAPGGIFVQWAQAYSLAPEDLKMIARTLARHFAEVTLWRAEAPDLLFVGRTETPPLEFARLRGLWHLAGLREDFEAMNVHRPEGIVAYFLLDDAPVRQLAAGSVLNTDDLTLLEYHAPQTLLARDLFLENQQEIAQLRTGPLPGNLEAAEVRMALEAGAETALDLRDTANAQRFLTALRSQPETVAGDIAKGRLDLLQGSAKKAKADLQVALKLDGNSVEAMHWLAIAENQNGEKTEARATVDKILEREPGNLTALTDEMEFAADREDFRIALLAQLTRMKAMLDPTAAEYCRLGAIWIKLSNFAEAEQALQKGIVKDSYSYACTLEMGEIYRETGRYAEARESFEKLIRLYPDLEVNIYKSLAGVYLALGDKKSAEAVLRKGHRMFPEDGDLRKSSAE